MSDCQKSESLLRTKLHKPQVTKEIVSRGRVSRLLDRGLTTPLTVVSAPAGYGKSVAVGVWSTKIESLNAWLSLDAEESNPIVFLEYVTAALCTVVPDSFTQTWKFVTAPKPPPLSEIVGSLVNELGALAKPLVLTLDDYHRIDPNSANFPYAASANPAEIRS